MTPLIDVVFLLLIFFVCASVGQEAESLLPTALAAGSVATPEPVESPPVTSRLWVYLTRPDAVGDVVMKVEQRQCATFAELADNLKTLGDVTPESPVILDIGPNVPLETVVDTWDVCNQAGFQSINFAAKQDPRSPR